MDWVKVMKTKCRSNCFVAAIIIWLRLGGRVIWKKPHRFCPFGHFGVIVKKRFIEFVDCYSARELANWRWYKFLWFQGRLNRITRK
jgi:hypothetical protein